MIETRYRRFPIAPPIFWSMGQDRMEMMLDGSRRQARQGRKTRPNEVHKIGPQGKRRQQDDRLLVGGANIWV